MKHLLLFWDLVLHLFLKPEACKFTVNDTVFVNILLSEKDFNDMSEELWPCIKYTFESIFHLHMHEVKNSFL